MAFDIEQFAALRPFLYHVTARENAGPLADTRVLQPAETLLRWAGRPELVRERRRDDLSVKAGVHRLVLKDQKPLIEANVQLPVGWEFGDLVAYLNRHVFFWPGSADGPIVQGQRLHSHYEADSPLVVRVRTASLLAANPEGIPLFAAFNTGAPRRQRGERVARGPDLFTIAADFPRRAFEVVEVVFRSQVPLPEDAEVAAESGWVLLGDRSV